METVFLYLLKASLLNVAFYAVYTVLLRKETFFCTNRWFLLSGLVISTVLPFLTLTRIIYVAPSPIVPVLSTPSSAIALSEASEPSAINWFMVLFGVYATVSLLLTIRLMLNSASLFRILKQGKRNPNKHYTLIDTPENVAPFSFFGYIVYNSSLYTEGELHSILTHEKIHSNGKHSIDSVLSTLYTLVFWFNPIAYAYKKAIAQNLEFIADREAIAGLQDPKQYQLAMLKVGTRQDNFPLTNTFYQSGLPEGKSLIKKRIVMLNTNQSRKQNVWKYATILPLLVLFMLFFQVKTVAQETKTIVINSQGDAAKVVIDKNTSDSELKEKAATMKAEGVTLKFSKVKRNSEGEITGIKVEFKDDKGNKGVNHIDSSEPIHPIFFYKTAESVGFGKPKGQKIISANSSMVVTDNGITIPIEADTLISLADRDMNFDFNFDFNGTADDIIAFENTAPKMLLKGNGGKPFVMINGKIISDEINPAELMEKLGVLDAVGEIIIETPEVGETSIISIDGKEIRQIKRKAIEEARREIKEIRPKVMIETRKEMEAARADMQRQREEMSRDRMESLKEMQQLQRESMEEARREMEKAREEMLKAKAEMEKMRAEMEKEKAKLGK